MPLFVQVRCAGRVATALVVLLVLDAIVGARTIPFPSAALGAQGIALRLLLPVGSALAIRRSLACGDPERERLSPRPVGWYDAAGVAAYVAVLVAATAVQNAIDPTTGWLGVRGALGLIGVALVEMALIGRSAPSIAPVLLVLVSATFGGAAGGSASWWAWAVDPSPARRSWVIAGGLFAAGLAATGLRLERRRRHA
ncbi:MAG: hypothetical protein U0Q22_13350 [Acidimicrobiales bacterium]